MKFLVTGGSGFLGSYLISALQKISKNKIYIIDKKKPKYRSKNIVFIRQDLNHGNHIQLKKYDFDYIFHMAAELGVKNVIDNPIYTFDKNYISTIKVLDFAKKNKSLKRFFYFSTSEVYSKLNKNGKMSEKDKLFLPDIFHPRTSYWLAKIAGEFLTINSRLNYTIFRIFNVYGSDNKFTHVIPSIFKKLKSNKKVVFQNPSHERSFLFIDDFVEMVIKSLNNKFKNKIINIGNPSETIKIKDLIKKIKMLTKSKTKYKLKNFPNQSIQKRVPDINKFKKLNYDKFKFTNLNIGLKKIYETTNKNQK